MVGQGMPQPTSPVIQHRSKITRVLGFVVYYSYYTSLAVG